MATVLRWGGDCATVGWRAVLFCEQIISRASLAGDPALSLRRTSCWRDIRTPTRCRRVIVPAGVVHARSSEVDIVGNASFTNNAARYDGGEKGRTSPIACNAARKIITCSSTSLQYSTVLAISYIQKVKHKASWPFLPLTLTLPQG